jgi:hypothetical protein
MLNRGGRGVASRFDARADARVEQMGEPKSALIIVSANGVFGILRQRPGHPCLATTFRFTASVCGAGWIWLGIEERHLHRGLALASSRGEATEPVQYSPAELFLVSQLGCSCPKCDLFATFANVKVCALTFSSCRRVN